MISTLAACCLSLTFLLDRDNMMFLAFTRQNKTTAAIEVTTDEGIPQLQIIVNRYKPKDVHFIAELWNVPQPEALAKLNEVCENLEPDVIETIEFEPREGVIEALLNSQPITPAIPDPLNPAATSAPSPRSYTLYVREINQLKQHGKTYTGDNLEAVFKDSLSQLPHYKEPLIEWTDTDSFCCLDVDYHDVETLPTWDELNTLVSSIQPQPLAWHMSHGHGAKLYYVHSPAYTATELAAVAGISWIGLDCRASFDLIKSTRHPCYPRSRDNSTAPCDSVESISFLYGESNVSTLRKLLSSDVEYSDVDDYLQSNGYHFGSTLPHSLCPINPTADDKLNVFVGEKGIYCHRCRAKGYGSGQPGFVSYAQLVGTIDNRLSTMVKNFCHLEHAKVVLQNLYPKVGAKTLADIYRVMLKIVHTPDDPRINMAMLSGKGFIRTKGKWVTVDGTESLIESKPAFINSLPATKYIDRTEGKLVPDVNKVVAFVNAGDIEEYGYPDISFLRGCKVYGQFLPYKKHENIKVIVRPEFKNCVPLYVPPSQRMPSEIAWGMLDSVFPGIDRNYVKLLICAKGAAEGRLAQCPFLLVCGPSSAGKSTTVHIAAGICGDKADEPTFTPIVERFRQGLLEGARNSGFICVNEVFKMAERARLSYTQAIDPMLSLTEDSRSHELYIGSVPFGRLPVFVLTDINIPVDVERDYQLARRFTFYRLGAAHNWQDNIIHAGISPHEFRLISYDHNAAADAILSEVIDEFFKVPTPLHEMADKLQSGTLEEYSGEKDRTSERLRQLYNEVVKAPALIGSHLTRYPYPGWKMIDRVRDDALNDIWIDLCDGKDAETWCKSRTVESQDWSKILSLDFPTICEIRSSKGNQNVLYIRFCSTENRRKPMWVNGKTIKPE